MAKFELSLGTVAIAAALVWLFAFGGVATLGKIFGGQAQVTPPPGTGGIVPTNGACPATLGTSFQGDFINSLDLSAASYGGMPMRLVPDGSFSGYTAYTAAALSTRATAVTLKCDHDYQIITVPAVDTFNPLSPISLGRISGVSVERAVQGSNFSLLTLNAYDNVGRTAMWDTTDLDLAAGEYATMAAHFDSSTNDTATAIGVGGTLDWDFLVKTVTNMEQFGNSNLGVYIAVDADKSDFDAPLLQLDGVTLADGKTELSADDLATLSAYEYVYKIPAGINFQNAPKTLRFYVAAKAGVNPDVDIVLRFLAKSNYVGMDGFTIYTDVFNRASASETISATASTVTIDLS